MDPSKAYSTYDLPVVNGMDETSFLAINASDPSPAPLIPILTALSTGSGYVNGTFGTLRLYLGTSTISWIATDFSSNQATCTYNVTVTDQEPPSLQCPSVSVNNTAGLPTGTVSTSILVTDNNDAPRWRTLHQSSLMK
eukprot:g72015.t1